MSRGRLASWLVAATAAALLAGCGAIPPLPTPVPTNYIPSVAPPPSLDPAVLTGDGIDATQQMAVRIRNVGCDSLSTGTGFAIDETTLITNKHVVADSQYLQVQTYDGRDVAVTAASMASLADLAVVRTTEPLPAFPSLAASDPAIGDSVVVVGYPNGGELTVTQGEVLSLTNDPLNENLGQVYLTSASVEPGSSGSAALNTGGEVIGVVYAKNQRSQSLMLPVSTLRMMLTDVTAFQPVGTCEIAPPGLDGAAG